MSRVPLPAQAPLRHVREEESCAGAGGGKSGTGKKGKGSSTDPSPLPPRSSSGTSVGTVTHPEGSWHIPAPSFTTLSQARPGTVFGTPHALPPVPVCPYPGRGPAGRGRSCAHGSRGPKPAVGSGGNTPLPAARQSGMGAVLLPLHTAFPELV